MAVVFGVARIAGQPVCGFIPESVVDSLEMDDGNKRLAAAQSLLNMISQVPVDSIDFRSFLVFCQPFFLDNNFTVINCFNEMIEFLLPKVGSGCLTALEEFLTLVITPLSDTRRAVRILVVNLMLLFLEASQSLNFLMALFPFFEDQSAVGKTEILDFAAQALHRFRPGAEVYALISEVLKNSFMSTAISVQNAATHLLNQACAIHPDYFRSLPKSIISCLSDEDRNRLSLPARAPNRPLIARLTKPEIDPKGRSHAGRRRTHNSVSASLKMVHPPGIISASGLGSPEQTLDDLRDRYSSASSDSNIVPKPPGPRPPDCGRRTPTDNPRLRRLASTSPRGTLPALPSNPSGLVSPNYDSIEDICELLQTPDWEVQNDTIIALIDMVQQKPKFISQNLRVLVFGLMTSVSSLRSALAETALTCLREISSEFGEYMTPFFEPIVGHLFTILASNRRSIARLAADCVSAILVNIDRNAALEFLGKDHGKRTKEIREHLALCIDALCGDCYEPSQLLPSIASLLMDERENTREHAMAAIAQLKQKFDYLEENVMSAKLAEDQRDVVLKAIKEAPEIVDLD
jgi:hypothetical protein